MSLLSLISQHYSYWDKHNNDPKDLRWDVHYSKWRPNKKEIEEVLWCKVEIEGIRKGGHTHYVIKVLKSDL